MCQQATARLLPMGLQSDLGSELGSALQSHGPRVQDVVLQMDVPSKISIELAEIRPEKFQ